WEAFRGLLWLLALQNRDGGWPTFCRGWGTLPFDRSGTDLTAHVLRALHAWGRPESPYWNRAVLGRRYSFMVRDGSGEELSIGIHRRDTEQSISRGLNFLRTCQRADGSWLPPWFGNQDAPDDVNPTYGSARVQVRRKFRPRLML